MASILRRFFGGAASNAGGYAIGGAITPALNPITQELANVMWAKNPHMPIPVEVLAGLVARDLLDVDEAKREARKSGFDHLPFDQIVAGASHAPETAEVLDLWRRGVVGEAAVEQAFTENGVRDIWRGPLKALRRVLPSVTDMVRFAVREVYDPTSRTALDLDAEFPAAFEADAENIGLDPQRARQFWAAHWQLPSREEGAAMLHRGEISAAQFEGLLKALDYAPTWRDKLREISRPIPPLQDMIRFAVREVYDPAKRKALGLDAEFPQAFAEHAKLHGFAESDARDEWAAHWRLPSAQQGYQMLWRGEITAAELDGLLKALDYPTLWRDRLANIAYHVPGRVDLRRMLAAKIIDRDRVKRGYRELGYNAETAEIQTRLAEHLAQGSGSATKWADRARSSLFTATKREYLDSSLDEAGARAKLEVVGATGAEQDAVIQAWNAEHEIQRRELTPAEIRKAYKKTLYTQEEAISELIERGMSSEDADTYLQSG